ncbi:pyridoxal-phosphate dependent enzyme [Nonomuraea sp. NN258]|uniref:pyridoxal-phosphate dependent enzyme n=1 Tax=Nonomuraea antri TaxID=2730852 RepID=UPI001569E0B9|nr:pyridoxal-phosphate dependent enzyme [Nonomuraea antri]NRQ35201.1 pyridoxal-phosphate dependent enzyme [Nonomuraea antri]
MFFRNPRRSPYTAADRAMIGAEHATQARAHFAGHRAYRPTPLREVPGIGRVKDESSRMGLGSFKALGGAYAVHLLAERDQEGAPFVCASAGNHGISVASGARESGVRCVVYLSHGVPETFAQRLRALGADVRRAGDDYDGSVAAAQRAADEHGWRLVADTSWYGYTEIPIDVMRGYTVLFDEVGEQDPRPPTHVFVQAGVGGLAGAAAGYVRDRWGEEPVIVVVEPEGAPCLIDSARAGKPVRAEGAPTTLGRLDCLEPSLVAFRLLEHLADAFMTITDRQAEQAAELLARHGVALSACGAAGAAGLLALDDADRAALRLGPDARVLLVGTEGPVKPV